MGAGILKGGLESVLPTQWGLQFVLSMPHCKYSNQSASTSNQPCLDFYDGCHRMIYRHFYASHYSKPHWTTAGKHTLPTRLVFTQPGAAQPMGAFNLPQTCCWWIISMQFFYQKMWKTSQYHYRHRLITICQN